MPPETRYARSGNVSIAYHLPGARDVELPGIDHLPFCDNAGRVLAEVAAFLRDLPGEVEAEPDRVLAPVLFVDVVGSTERALAVGDRRRREELEAFHRAVRRELARVRGRELDTAGDGVLAAFDGPARAAEAMQPLGLIVRAGLHTGEREVMGDKLAGIAVHVGARVAGEAAPGEGLMSSTVRGLVAGSGLRFSDRGARALKGMPGDWRLFAVERDAA